VPNLRIIYDNAADRSVIVASSAASSDMGVANVYTDIKSDVWRSIGTTATLTATWPARETIGGVVLPFCNLSSRATIRVRGYAEVADAAPLFDTGAVYACPAPVLGMWNWGAEPLGSNSFAYGGGTYGRVWIPVPGAVKKLAIDIEDATNKDGYLEASRLVCGAYWSPKYNFDYGHPLTPVDTSKHYRNAAGDLVTDAGTKHRQLSFNLSRMSPTDRAEFWSIVRSNGMTRPMLASLYPNNVDTRLEQDYQVYMKITMPEALTSPQFQQYVSSIEGEEI
jgi:hypothetical protein